MADVTIPDFRAKRSMRRWSIGASVGLAIVAMMPLIVLHLLAPLLMEPDLMYQGLNSVGQMYFAGVFGLLAFSLLRSQPDAIWTPIFWLPVHVGVFFGIGPLVEVFGNEATLNHLSNYALRIGTDELVRANALSVVGATMMMLGYFVHIVVFKKAWIAASGIHTQIVPNFKLLRQIACLFVLIGFGVRYGFVLPRQYDGQVVAGLLGRFAYVLDAGYALMAFLMGRRKEPLLLLIFALTFPVHILLAFVSFAKSAVVVALMMPTIGGYLGHMKFRRLMIQLSVIGLLYAGMQPYVNFGRETILSRTGAIYAANYGERFMIAADYLQNGDPENAGTERNERQSWWSRLSFVGQQSFAIKLYDSGEKGDTLRGVWMYFIPRAIWPDKPVLYAPGLQFYSLVTNSDRHSFMPATVYGDLYWQFGWSGVILGAPAVGWIFAVMSIYCLRFIKQRRLIMLPVLAMAVEMSASSLSKFVINGIIAPLPTLVVYFVIFALLSGKMRRRI